MGITEPDVRWFDEASLGMFIHWGLSSVDAQTDLSWGMVKDKPWDEDNESYIPPDEYFELAEEFDPDAYSPDKWLTAARQAGMEYAVLTTKHHEGFALWPSEYGDFSTAEYLDGHDLVGEFVDACRRQGIRVGFYFSLADWHHPDWPDIRDGYPGLEALRESRMIEDVEEIRRFEEYYNFVSGQVQELVTRYGNIDLLWFDYSLWGNNIDNRIGNLYNLARSHNPGIVMNGRGKYTEWGDYDTPENELPEKPPGERWELCQTWAEDGWGYVEDETYRNMDWTLERVARTVGKGGNLLLNVGPKGDGTLPDEAYDRLDSLSSWMDHSEPSVRDINGGPWPPQCELPITRRTGTWYLHHLSTHEGPVEVRSVPEPESVFHLRTNQSLVYTHEDNDLTIQSDIERNFPDEVIVVSWQDEHQHLISK